jgi:hypothetical protein
VQPMPLAVAERRAHVGDGGGIGHRPVRRSRPPRSGCRAALGGGLREPGITTPVVAAAVTSLSWAMPKTRSRARG